MEVIRKGENELDDIITDGTSMLPFSLNGGSLCLCGKVACHEEPENTFRKRFLVELVCSGWVCFGEEFLEFGNCESSEDNSLVRIAAGEVAHEAFHASHSTNNLFDSVLSNYLIAILLFDFFEVSLFLGDDFSENFLEVGLSEVELGLLGETLLLSQQLI